MSATPNHLREAIERTEAAAGILRNPYKYGGLITRIAENTRVQQELHLLSLASTEYMTRAERTILSALQSAAMEQAREELP